MLPRSFVFLPGIGPTRELRLWNKGVESWADYRNLSRVLGIRPRLKAHHDQLLEMAEAKRTTDPAFFARMLPTTEHWRAYSTYEHRAAYVDIETTGDRANQITVVGVHYKGETRAFVRPTPGATDAMVAACGGEPYTPEAVSEFLADVTCFVTFNGASFDLPVMAGEGIVMPAVPHADLRTVFTRIGYSGGLKKIETALGVERDDDLQGLTGWDAVKMWRRWVNRQDAESLRTLLAYNIADCANLEPLAQFACGKLVKQTLAGITSQTRLEGSSVPATATGP